MKIDKNAKPYLPHNTFFRSPVDKCPELFHTNPIPRRKMSETMTSQSHKDRISRIEFRLKVFPILMYCR